MLRAGIDIGTNTILLLVAEVVGNKVVRVVEDHVRIVRLGQGVDKNHTLHPDAKERARACFRDYAAVLQKYPGIPVHAAATSGSRDAKDSPDFFQEITRGIGIPIRVISGEEEAEVSFRGALPEGADPEQVAVLDIGGGSTEVVGKEKGKLFKVSFNMGCVRLTERYLQSDPPTSGEREGLLEFVRESLSREKEILGKIKGRRFIGVAGTPTYLSSAYLGLAKFDPEKIHGSVLRLADLSELRERLEKLPSRDRIGLGGMDQGRADVIVSGALVLEEVLKAAGVDALEVSVRGLRYGLVLDRN